MNYPKDPIVDELITLIKKRSDEGLEKYGTPMTRTDLQAGFWQQAAIEEMIDFLLYFLRLRRTREEATTFAQSLLSEETAEWPHSPRKRLFEDDLEELLDFIYGTGKKDG